MAVPTAEVAEHFRLRQAARAASAATRENRMNVRRAVRFVAVALIAAATFVGGMQAASAAPTHPLTADLAAMWKAVLQTPTDQNPFAVPAPPQGSCKVVRQAVDLLGC